MKKLKLQLDDLAVESFATAEEQELRGTVGAHLSCQTCEDIDCTAICTNGSCQPGTGTGTGSGTTPCGPSESAAIFGCGSGVTSCHTYFEWTGCDWSCVEGPCNSHHPDYCR